MKNYLNKSFNSNKLFSIFLLVILCMVISFGLAACSNQAGEKTNQAVEHTHPANKCIGEVTHSHPNGKRKHQHYFHYCESSGIKSNAHTHPSSSSITGFIRHVHPNGAIKHTHRGLK